MCASDYIECCCSSNEQAATTYDKNEQFSKTEIISEFLGYLKEKNRFCIVNWQPTKSEYPNHIFLSGDKGILAYLDFQYLESENSFTRRNIQISSNLLLKKLQVADSQLDRPIFFIYFLNYVDKHGVFFETNEQIKDRWFHNEITNETYSPVIEEMGDYNNLISILTDLKKNNVRV